MQYIDFIFGFIIGAMVMLFAISWLELDIYHRRIARATPVTHTEYGGEN